MRCLTDREKEPQYDLPRENRRQMEDVIFSIEYQKSNYTARPTRLSVNHFKIYLGHVAGGYVDTRHYNHFLQTIPGRTTTYAKRYV